MSVDHIELKHCSRNAQASPEAMLKHRDSHAQAFSFACSSMFRAMLKHHFLHATAYGTAHSTAHSTAHGRNACLSACGERREEYLPYLQGKAPIGANTGGGSMGEYRAEYETNSATQTQPLIQVGERKPWQVGPIKRARQEQAAVKRLEPLPDVLRLPHASRPRSHDCQKDEHE